MGGRHPPALNCPESPPAQGTYFPPNSGEPACPGATVAHVPECQAQGDPRVVALRTAGPWHVGSEQCFSLAVQDSARSSLAPAAAARPGSSSRWPCCPSLQSTSASRRVWSVRRWSATLLPLILRCERWSERRGLGSFRSWSVRSGGKTIKKALPPRGRAQTERSMPAPFLEGRNTAGSRGPDSPR